MDSAQRHVRYDREEQRHYYECPCCGARSYSQAAIAEGYCAPCGRSADELDPGVPVEREFDLTG